MESAIELPLRKDARLTELPNNLFTEPASLFASSLVICAAGSGRDGEVGWSGDAAAGYVCWKSDTCMARSLGYCVKVSSVLSTQLGRGAYAPAIGKVH